MRNRTLEDLRLDCFLKRFDEQGNINEIYSLMHDLIVDLQERFKFLNMVNYD